MRYLYCLMLLVLLNSCVSVPREAPELSQELGIQIQEIENSHFHLLTLFFNKEREKVQTFVNEAWLPLFAEQFFMEPNISAVWDRVVESGDANDRMQFITRTAPEIHLQTNKKYLELIEPLNSLEAEVSSSLRNKYDMAKSTNQVLTSFLYSSSKVDENRQRYLDMVGITRADTNRVLTDMENLTDGMLQGANTLEELENDINDYISRGKLLLSNFKK